MTGNDDFGIQSSKTISGLNPCRGIGVVENRQQALIKSNVARYDSFPFWQPSHYVTRAIWGSEIKSLDMLVTLFDDIFLMAALLNISGKRIKF
jgi:hypothetical protein